ncbi:hypothetical protein [Methylobacterium gregans]|uniref:Uncharacterized protein n=1 Tax=Methylobacterium gregans TaxID=374424 RepID=A0AA37MAM8_9HYPH|nr:hypothetical protein [Methylobacterium gregans]MDQ0519391.1 hypothetical protein [Methylobacterium gregans]GJD78677.1 hypothetical protein NBEOAGPD_1895 [Methylobacterium gregans]GLS52968.1 hypothetical protein GCM10007886_11510 [Methylobacterium gregans]
MPLARPTLPVALLLAGLPISALAQAQAPDLTGTGGGPTTTITAPYTNREGVTKPPGAALGPRDMSSAAAERREERVIDRIENSICTGCED